MMPANDTAKKPHNLPARAGSRPRMYRASSQLCGPANRNTVAIETATGAHPARSAAAAARVTSPTASGKPGEDVLGVSSVTEDMKVEDSLAGRPPAAPLNDSLG